MRAEKKMQSEQNGSEATHDTSHAARLGGTYRTPIGGAFRYWAPVVLTAIVVPGGIVVALVMLARRWYRGRPAASGVDAGGARA